MIEEREIKLKHTKRRLTEEEAIQRGLPPKKELTTPQTEPGGGNCEPWYIMETGDGIHFYTCRVCWQGYPTAWPVQECIGPYPVD